MSAFIGRYAKLYNGGTAGTSYTEVTTVGDVSVPLEWTTARLAHRGTDYATYGIVDGEATLEFALIRNPADAQYTALRGHYLAKETVFLEAATGDRTVVGTEVAGGEWIITGWSVGEPLGEFSTVAVTCRLSASAVTPGLTLETVAI
jgi:hypothetical protein